MQPTRRGFIGQILGTIVATQLPFRVEAAQVRPTSTKLQQYTRMIRMMELPEAELWKCRLYALMENNLRIWVPGIEKVERDLEILQLRFTCQELRILQTCSSHGMGLLDDQGNFVRETMYSNMVNMVNGDSLRMTYTLLMG